MIPLSKDEWLESLPLSEEDEDTIPRELSPPPLKKEPTLKLNRRSLSKLPSDLPTRSQADWEGSDATTDAGDGEIRKMGGFEAFFSKAVAHGLGLIYYVVEVEGPVESKLLEQALRLSVKRHPNLRTRIVNRYMESIPFEECPPVRVPLVKTDDVLTFTEERLNTSPIKMGTELYLWELWLHQTPSDVEGAAPQQHLVLLAHHTILDGDSILKLLQELVAAMGRLYPMGDKERRAELARVEPLRQLPSQDELLYENYRGYWLIYHFRSLLKELFRVLRLPRVPRPHIYTTDYRERYTRITSFVLPPDVFKRLMAACKREGTTVTGALSAACMTEIQKHIPKEYHDYIMKLEVLVNFRGMINGVQGVDEALQLFAAPVDVIVEGGKPGAVAGQDATVPPPPSSAFWDMARGIKTDIDDFAKQPHQICETLDFFRVLGTHPISWPLLQWFGHSFKQGRYKAVSISNLGRTDGRFEAVGGFGIGRMQMGIDELLFGHTFFVAAASYRGALNMTISYPEPIVTRELAEAYGQGLLRQLEEVARQVPGA